MGKLSSVDAACAARMDHADVLPPHVLRARFPLAAAHGFACCIAAVTSLLARRQLPTLEALTARLESGSNNSDLDTFTRLGGSPLHGLAAVLHFARATSATHGDGSFDFGFDGTCDDGDDEDGEPSNDKRMRELPYMTLALEDDYSLLFATLVGPQLDCNRTRHRSPTRFD
jgi:hypothetical protein